MEWKKFVFKAPDGKGTDLSVTSHVAGSQFLGFGADKGKEWFAEMRQENFGGGGGGGINVFIPIVIHSYIYIVKHSLYP